MRFVGERGRIDSERAMGQIEGLPFSYRQEDKGRERA